MRRFLFGLVCFALGLLTLPLLAMGARFVSAHQAFRENSVDADASEYEPPEAVVTSEEVRIALPAIDQPVEQSDCVAVPDSQFADAETVIAQPEEVPFIENDLSLIGSVVEPVAELGVPATPRIVLPATPVMLATGESADAAEADKLIELRETLKRTVESKSALLNADALQAEIAMHQRHQADLQALLELQRLQKGLEELSDKYPDSDAGLRAKEVLQMLKNRGAVPVYNPTPAESFVPGTSYVPAAGTPGVVPAPDDEQFADPRSPNFTRRTRSPMPRNREQPIKPKLPTY